MSLPGVKDNHKSYLALPQVQGAFLLFRIITGEFHEVYIKMFLKQSTTNFRQQICDTYYSLGSMP